MARVKVEPAGKVLIAVVIIGALLLLFLKVIASSHKNNVTVESPQPSVVTKPSNVAENKVTQKPAEVTPPESNKPIKIFFDFDRASINKNVYCIFDRIDETVQRIGRQHLRIVIEGNADSIGPSRYNFSLSKMRAVRVADSLSKRLRIPLNTIELVANGSTRPVSSNETREGRAENRRTEVHIYY